MSQCYKKSLCFSQWQVINLSEPREELRRLNVKVKSTIQKVWLQDIFITWSLHGHVSLSFIYVCSLRYWMLAGPDSMLHPYIYCVLYVKA